MQASCASPIPIFEAGEQRGEVCAERAAAAGLTVIDLGETWVPAIFEGDDVVGPAPYRDRFVRTAREDFENVASWDRERRDRFFELYGIFPTFAVMGKRLRDEERHACHAALPSEGLRALEESIDTWRSRDKQRGDRLEARRLLRRLEAAAAKQGTTVADLASDPRWAAEHRAQRRLTVRTSAIREMQNHLRCERLLGDEAEAALLDGPTIDAMFAYLRRHMIISWQLDDEVRETLLTDSRELDFRQTLRALRERVIDATGIIEDGTAAGRHGQVVGREIDTRVIAKDASGAALDRGADDLVARATDEAARALGWLDPAETARRIAAGLPSKVALHLSPAPEYHTAHMDLVSVIDPGDVIYDPPDTRPKAGAEIARRDRLPSLVLYARTPGGEIPLVRWPTTVGGWQPEWVASRRRVMLVYKESPSGQRQWRDLIAEPRWIPPDTTPERDLLRPRADGTWAPRLDTFGPSYASAYGLAMLIHHGRTADKLSDNGIRTHGSASYASIFEGYSHGCHRLHNHRALRLGGFLLDHRRHVVRGDVPVGYVRTFQWRNQPVRLEFASRGFRYELDPPVPVEVLKGHPIGTATSPLPPKELSKQLLGRYGRGDD